MSADPAIALIAYALSATPRRYLTGEFARFVDFSTNRKAGQSTRTEPATTERENPTEHGPRKQRD